MAGVPWVGSKHPTYGAPARMRAAGAACTANGRYVPAQYGRGVHGSPERKRRATDAVQLNTASAAAVALRVAQAASAFGGATASRLRSQVRWGLWRRAPCAPSASGS